MNEYYDLFFELENETDLAENLKDLAQVLEGAIQCKDMPFEPKQYAGAFTLLTTQLRQHQKNLEKIMNEGFEIMKQNKSKKAGVVNE